MWDINLERQLEDKNLVIQIKTGCIRIVELSEVHMP